mmetsp:Transcript_76796/g.140538  ORF Transcript_76796/g.140538 Transcript_76796/m.140538 type:complete len:264 (+) Transcript_76796:426-1217(+)
MVTADAGCACHVMTRHGGMVALDDGGHGCHEMTRHDMVTGGDADACCACRVRPRRDDVLTPGVGGHWHRAMNCRGVVTCGSAAARRDGVVTGGGAGGDCGCCARAGVCRTSGRRLRLPEADCRSSRHLLCRQRPSLQRSPQLPAAGHQRELPRSAHPREAAAAAAHVAQSGSCRCCDRCSGAPSAVGGLRSGPPPPADGGRHHLLSSGLRRTPPIAVPELQAHLSGAQGRSGREAARWSSFEKVEYSHVWWLQLPWTPPRWLR